MGKSPALDLGEAFFAFVIDPALAEKEREIIGRN